jgi:SAM-dependent methyltransferase
MTVSPDTARQWIERWDRQQEGYLPDRELLFDVITDAVEAAAARPDPLVIDLGCGPGSLSARIRARLPEAHVIGVDTDPVLLSLAAAGYGLPLVSADLRDTSWVAALRLERAADAVVSTTALHWLDEDRLATVYAQAAGLLRPGGILVNGDSMPSGGPGVDALADVLARRQAERYGTTDRETWEPWWEAIAAEPELAGPVAERNARAYDHPESNELDCQGHLRLLSKAGFREVGVLWQYGNRRVITGLA